MINTEQDNKDNRDDKMKTNVNKKYYLVKVVLSINKWL